ncbi:glycosyltransferase family 2 protein [Thermanaerothrix sp. 4228-RoL]|uniref:Glycosyltransferase family 2 protein n=1 Tax=Thermanaerothrix solaris TaxID=3058434 RepID=A0ABU3NJF0_9CHLR|nr:glycosyltransferase family 2 protein [Thermanaerothrix sp. 4228-RoL]MDT8896983.1 glycosyltransferase family 2 protein [Thermanaerothrix sp. 4228-RoL]
MAGEKYPFVSVVMPVRNERDYIQQSLEAVLAQDYPRECMEILIVDGMSEDGTREYVCEQQKHVPNLYLLDNPGKIVPVGLNIAIAKAKGEIVVRVDGHCIIAPDYIRRCVDYLEREPIVGVGGPMETVGETPTARTIALAMSSLFGVGNSAFRVHVNSHRYVDTIPFPAYRMSTLREAGPFDEDLIRNQDDEYNYRLRSMGGKLLLAPDVRSKYYSRGSLKALWRQYFQYGFFKVRVLQKHPAQFSLRQLIPPAFVGTLLVALVLSVFIVPMRYFLLGLLVVYTAVNFGVSLLIAIRHGWEHFWRLPPTFAILHIAYGLGFLTGLLKAIARKN